MTALPATHAIELDLDDGWLTIWLNQPEKRNALTDELRREVIAVLDAVRDDRSVRGITLRGRGGVFCAGGDMKQFQSDFQGSASLDDIRAMSRDAAAVMDAVYCAPQVTVVLVEGAAMAGGFGLMCCADVIIAQNSAKFAMTEAMIGLSPAQISPFVVDRVGRARARRLMVTAERIDGTAALSMGLVDHIGEQASDLEAIEADVKKRVLKCAPVAVAQTKGLLQQLPISSREEEVDICADLFARQMQGDEAREGVASFLEKRKPAWAAAKENGK